MSNIFLEFINTGGRHLNVDEPVAIRLDTIKAISEADHKSCWLVIGHDGFTYRVKGRYTEIRARLKKYEMQFHG